MCGATSSCREPFLDLSLAVCTSRELDGPCTPKYSPKRLLPLRDKEAEAATPMRLEDCLAHFTSTETLGDLHICATCGAAVNRTKQLTLDVLPNILIIHLKRFDALKSCKIANPIEFPVDQPLDLGPFIFKWRRRDRTSSVPTPHLYELNAVVDHHGDMHKGHYTAFIKDGGQWFHCDDHHVALVNTETVKAAEGYLLFYVRKTLTIAVQP